jgi:hypothetical protein
MTKKIVKTETLGSVLAIIFGSALHFVYQWSGYQKIVALIAAVNESTWEHLKLGFWPLLIWAIIEYFVFGKGKKNFIFAKAITLFSFCILVPLIFYSYSALLGTNYLFLDILTFIVSVLIAQYIGFRLISFGKDLRMKTLGIILIVVLIIMFLSFSFFPPKLFLFKDPVSGGYGVDISSML